jgi:hypothetical protein
MDNWCWNRSCATVGWIDVGECNLSNPCIAGARRSLTSSCALITDRHFPSGSPYGFPTVFFRTSWLTLSPRRPARSAVRHHAQHYAALTSLYHLPPSCTSTYPQCTTLPCVGSPIPYNCPLSCSSSCPPPISNPHLPLHCLFKLAV